MWEIGRNGDSERGRNIVHSNRRACIVMSEVPGAAKFLDRVVRRGTFPLEESGRAFRTRVGHFPRGGKRRAVHEVQLEFQIEVKTYMHIPRDAPVPS